MVTKEPALLLGADEASLMRRLLSLKIAAASAGVDVVQLVERQPALLLQVCNLLFFEKLLI